MRPLLLWLSLSTAALAAGVPYFSDPALCPTRPEIAFVSGGDIWVAPAKGGEAHLLVSDPAEESRPLYSPDGARLAFVSTRTGGGDIYVLTLASGDLKRLTFDDRLDQLDSWSRDGKWIYFSNGTNDVGGKNDIYRVSVEGGTPMPVSADRFTNEFQAAPAPDGSTVAFAARGNGDSQWWRHGHSHLDEAEIWLRKEGSPAVYEKIVDLNGRNAWPMWMPDGKSLFFMSDRSGAENLWTLTLGGKMRQVTKFTNGRVLWPSISYDGKAVVFERDFKIWQLDTKNGEAYAIPITLVGSAFTPEISHLTLNTFNDLSLSADGRKVALIAHGEVFAASAHDGGAAFRVTRTPGPETQVAWAPDSTRLAYLSERDALTHVFLYDFAHHAETQLTNDTRPDSSVKFSPDGKSLAFVRNRKELRVIDLESKQDHLVASGFISGAYAWAPDDQWLAFVAADDHGLRNIYVAGAAGGEKHQVSFLANSNTNSVDWSPDGKFLIFETGQRTETPQLVRVDLVPKQPKYAEDKFDDLFKPEPAGRGRGAAAGNGENGGRGGRSGTGEPKPPVKVEFEFDHIRERASVLNTAGLTINNPVISPDGKYLLYSGTAGGQSNLYLYPLEEQQGGRGGRGGGGGGRGGAGGPARQLTNTAAMRTHAQFSADSRDVYFLEGGKVSAIGVENKQTRVVNVDAEMDVDFNHEKMAVFEEAWAAQRDNYADPKYNGADWDGVRKTYAPLIEGAHNPEEMRAILRLMIGELNSSHSGISAPVAQGGGGRGVVGQLGLTFDRAAYEASGTLKITQVLPHSPAELAKIQPGEELRAVDGVAMGPRVNLDEQLQHKIDKRVVLDISGRQVTVQPVASLADLIYRKWVEDNRAYVAKISNNRLGYVHLRDMSEQALAQLYLDLDEQNRSREGVVIDIRNNNGGFINAYALDVLTRRPYLTMTDRNGPAAPARTALGQRSLELPTILVVNQHSLSDAEDFTEGYRTLKLGKVVGEPTAGWIIYTGSVTLIDGTVMRMPTTVIRGADGKVMENNPRPVDVAVSRPIGESYTGKDSQLDVAVRELLAQIGSK
ncbi:MAG TPA: S41 family peptidase [Bryobacteraceae bacterium]|nr:S41 family peptidase [Bryobacteraceae bacterium]